MAFWLKRAYNPKQEYWVRGIKILDKRIAPKRSLCL